MSMGNECYLLIRANSYVLVSKLKRFYCTNHAEDIVPFKSKKPRGLIADCSFTIPL